MKDLLQQILDGQARIEKRLDSIENTMVTKDIFDKSIIASQDDIKAMLERTATKESIASLDAKFDLLNNRLFQTESKVAVIEKNNLLSIVK